MAAGTQFLFISHNKIAMEMAEQLIGVTDAGAGRLAHRRGRHGSRGFDRDVRYATCRPRRAPAANRFFIGALERAHQRMGGRRWR